MYDLRTNQHFTQKVNPLRRENLDDFVACYRPGRPRSERIETERFEPFTYEEIVARDKANLDLLWLKDDSLEDAADLPAPEVLAREIIEELEVALEEFTAIAESLEALQIEPPSDGGESRFVADFIVISEPETKSAKSGSTAKTARDPRHRFDLPAGSIVVTKTGDGRDLPAPRSEDK